MGRLRRAFNLGKEETPPLVNRVPRIPTLDEPPARKAKAAAVVEFPVG